MRKLNIPQHDPSEVYLECVAEVTEEITATKYLANKNFIDQNYALYSNASAEFTWCNLDRVPIGQGDSLIAGELTKEDLMKLYSTYMVRSKGAARQRYDAMLVAANGKCPFCGIGHIKTLDHYLPKANFPSFSILPVNLVPCCRDCNTGKSNSFPDMPTDQGLHPYLDNSHFFDERWVKADVLQTDPVTIRFIVDPPDHWSDIDKNRVQSHFDDYDLAARFGIEAASEISILVDQRRGILGRSSTEDFRDHLRDVANSNAVTINSWKRTMYQALSNDDWFCAHNFGAT